MDGLDLAGRQRSSSMDVDNSSQLQHADDDPKPSTTSASTRNQPARGAKSNTNGTGPIRRTRTARATKQTSARKRYRNFGVQTGLDNFEEDPNPVARFVTPMQHPHPHAHPHAHPHPPPPPPPMPMPIREYQHSIMDGPPPPLPEGIPELMQGYPDPPSVPPESCRKLREHGINPHWLIKPPLGTPCHWRAQSCSTMRVDWRPGDWERHLQTHLPDDLKPYWDCPGCMKTFNRKDSFKRHLKRPETACSARVDVVTSSEWETIYYHEPLSLSVLS